MPTRAQKTSKMKKGNGNTLKSDETQAAANNESAAEEIAAAGEDSAGELDRAYWSIVTFENVAATNLTYAEALEWMEKLKKENISGLCIVTDEAAARISQ